MILLSIILRVFPLAHPIHTSCPQKQGMILIFYFPRQQAVRPADWEPPPIRFL